MNFPGFRLPDELLALREQIRRVVRDEVIPVEQRIDPDAPELPDDDYQTISAKTKAAGLWALGAPEQYGGDRWVLNGRKVFTSRAHDAPWGLVWARTDKAKGRGGISCFILEKGTPGFTAKPIKVIRTSAIPNDVTLEDCEVPAENLVGAEGQGLDLAF